MREKVLSALISAFDNLKSKKKLPALPVPASHQVVRPKERGYGDFASNLALAVAPSMKLKPRDIATAIVQELEGDLFFEKIEVAGPGFINFFISPDQWQKRLLDIHRAGESFGESNAGEGKRVLVEFVSANPTGPLHVGHGRGAAVGDSLARIMKAAGFDVEKEYYINDVGNQMNTLGASVYLRYQGLLGRKALFPKEYYQGDYIIDIAKKIIASRGKDFLDQPMESCLPFFVKTAVDDISAGIKKDLDDFGVSFDTWFSEKIIHDSGLVERTIEKLKQAGHIYEEDGALWFKTTAFGDEKDRVVRRSNGVLTYFAADMAYHLHKLERGYDLLVNIWGADHHGYVPRVKAAIMALGYPEDRLRVLLVQFVSLLEGGKTKSMSTRSGEFVTLREVLEEVGRDAARFVFLTRKSDSQLDFDLELAKRQGQENPVYYVQYAHARLSSILKNAEDLGLWPACLDEADPKLLGSEEDLDILKHLDAFPQVVKEGALALEPHRISYYLTELAGLFHNYYTKNRFIGEDRHLTCARLLLADTIRQVLKKALGLIGVSAPKQM
ncbi:arginine--tRNA ligase [Dissulfurimicrobium hydrothermale]|uniref:arginine--tRNA ligase n=1 Tax=Dissulfurimicrobium hydrothermale TaxID=1750598 RepID=UPI001EDA81B5|nr:arginine--tRNA ligase [Dissulfurimicrobium hydrothermale]UKL14054.1 arginine--tRNA ligase [Dissulfurimicrobium hydrothermale]